MNNDKPLNQWASENGISYWKARRDFFGNKINGAYQAENKRIFVKGADQPSTQAVQAVTRDIKFGEPREVEGYSIASTSTRYNKSAFTDPVGKYTRIENSYAPFTIGGATNDSSVSIRDILILCAKAYYNFSPVRLILDTVTEFSASPIYLTGSSKTATDFFESLFKTINFADFVEQFFLEFYRSGNCFIYRQDTTWTSEDINNLKKVYGGVSTVKLPSRYFLINPADVQVFGSSSFINPTYIKTLSDYELQRLRAGITDEDKRILKSLPTEVQKAIKDKNSNSVSFELDPNKLVVVFNRKMSYEPMATPWLLPVLADLEHKCELKSIDQSISRSLESSILHAKVGYLGKDGEYVFSQAVADKLTELFKNKTVARTLVTDFSTDIQFIIPQVSDILNSEKYEVVNSDIQTGLNNLIFGSGTDDKFSSSVVKIKVFTEKIRRAREAFLNNFLIPEIRRISKLMGFKNYPTPAFETIDMDDQTEYSRMVTRLAELGLLTPAQTFEALESGRMPTKLESVEEQKEFRKQKDEGLYEPLTGGPFSAQKLAELGAEAELKKLKATPGRPSGTKAPKKPTAIGSYTTSEIVKTLASYTKLEELITDTLCKKYKLESLNEAQKEIVNEVAMGIICSQQREIWHNKKVIASYIENPEPTPQIKAAIDYIAEEHNIDTFMAAILFNSKKSNLSAEPKQSLQSQSDKGENAAQ